MKLESVALATLEVGKVAEGRRAVDAVFVDQDLDLASVYDMLSEPGEAESDDGASPHRRSFDGTTTDADADEGIALPRGGINIVFAVSEEGEIVSAVDQQDLLRFTRLVVEDYVETKTPERRSRISSWPSSRMLQPLPRSPIGTEKIIRSGVSFRKRRIPYLKKPSASLALRATQL